MHDVQPGSKQSESDVEISDLSGAEHYRLLRAPAFVRALVVQPRLRMRLWRTATVGLALVLLLVVLSGSFSDIGQAFQNLFAQPLPTAAVQPIISASPGITLHGHLKTAITIAVNSKPQIVPFTEALGSVPHTCLYSTPTQLFDAPAFPAGLGRRAYVGYRLFQFGRPTLSIRTTSNARSHRKSAGISKCCSSLRQISPARSRCKAASKAASCRSGSARIRLE